MQNVLKNNATSKSIQSSNVQKQKLKNTMKAVALASMASNTSRVHNCATPGSFPIPDMVNCMRYSVVINWAITKAKRLFIFLLASQILKTILDVRFCRSKFVRTPEWWLETRIFANIRKAFKIKSCQLNHNKIQQQNNYLNILIECENVGQTIDAGHALRDTVFDHLVIQFLCRVLWITSKYYNIYRLSKILPLPRIVTQHKYAPSGRMWRGN